MPNIVYFFLTIVALFSIAKPVHISPETLAPNTEPVIVEKLPEPEQTPDIEEIPGSFEITELAPEIHPSIKIHNVFTTSTVNGGKEASAGRIWLVIAVEVSNQTNVPVSLGLNDIQWVSDSKTFFPSPETKLQKTAYELFSELNPHDHTEVSVGVIIFEVPVEYAYEGYISVYGTMFHEHVSRYV